jgi:hypothetical protein
LSLKSRRYPSWVKLLNSGSPAALHGPVHTKKKKKQNKEKEKKNKKAKQKRENKLKAAPLKLNCFLFTGFIVGGGV